MAFFHKEKCVFPKLATNCGGGVLIPQYVVFIPCRGRYFLAVTRKTPAGGIGVCKERISPGKIPGDTTYNCCQSQGRIGSKLAPKGVEAGVAWMVCSTKRAARVAATGRFLPNVSAPAVTAANISPVPCWLRPTRFAW